MNTAQQKLVVWTITGLLGAGLAGYLALSLPQFNSWKQTVSKERMATTLQRVPDVGDKREDMLASALVERGLKSLDWTGKPPPEKPVEEVKPNGNTGPVRELVRDLIQIRAIRYDAAVPAQSEVLLKYRSTAMVVAPGNTDGTFLKRAGDRLEGRLNQIEISAVYPGSVEFNFINEPNRDRELVAPAPFSLSRFYAVVEPGATPVSRTPVDVLSNIDRRPDAPPDAQTVQISPSKFRIGTEDAAEINDNYAEILTSDVSMDRHRDPKTRRFDGIEIKNVKPGSIAARHGVQDGDVIKSINGTPVSSKEEAIVFVKNNKDKYDVWEVEIWNKGQTRVVTYYPPKKK